MRQSFTGKTFAIKTYAFLRPPFLLFVSLLFLPCQMRSIWIRREYWEVREGSHRDMVGIQRKIQ